MGLKTYVYLRRGIRPESTEIRIETQPLTLKPRKNNVYKTGIH